MLPPALSTWTGTIGVYRRFEVKPSRAMPSRSRPGKMDTVRLGELSQCAAGGDKDAAQLVISELLPYWMRAAVSISDTRSDAEDLAQEAVLQLIVAWRQGKGPVTNTRSYVTAIMRNQAASHARSPRSRTVQASEDYLESLPASAQDQDLVDFAEEAVRVRRALSTLSEDHQAVLTAVVSNGDKPRDLVDQLSRPAPAISALLVRAKRALQRALLIEHLREGGVECEENAFMLPTKVAEHLEAHDVYEPGIAHVRACAKCQRNWRRFGTAVMAFGVLPALTVTFAGPTPTPASASTEQMSVSEGTASAGSVPRRVVARGVTSRSGHSFLGSRLFLLAGVSASLAAAALSAAWYFLGLSRDAPSQADQGIVSALTSNDGRPHLGMRAHRSLDGDGRLTRVSIQFTFPTNTLPSLRSLTFALPEKASVMSVSNGLACDTSSGQPLRCVATDSTDLLDGIQFSVEDAPAHGDLRIELELRSQEGIYHGEVRGSW